MIGGLRMKVAVETSTRIKGGLEEGGLGGFSVYGELFIWEEGEFFLFSLVIAGGLEGVVEWDELLCVEIWGGLYDRSTLDR